MNRPTYRGRDYIAGDQCKMRKCLKCGRMFKSTGPENRICGRHKMKRSKYEDWAEGPGEDS